MESKFVDKTDGHAGVLKHVVERQVFDVIIGGMNMRVSVLESGLDDKGRRIAGLGGGSMVGAGVSALGLNPGNVAVLRKLV